MKQTTGPIPATDLERNLEGKVFRFQPDTGMGGLAVMLGLLQRVFLPDFNGPATLVFLVLVPLYFLWLRLSWFKIQEGCFHVKLWPRKVVLPLDGLALTVRSLPFRRYRLVTKSGLRLTIPAFGTLSLDECSFWMAMKSQGALVPDTYLTKFFGMDATPMTEQPLPAVEEEDEVRFLPRSIQRIVAARVHWEASLDGAILAHEIQRGSWQTRTKGVLVLKDGRHAALTDWRADDVGFDLSLARKLAARGVPSILADPSDAPDSPLKMTRRV